MMWEEEDSAKGALLGCLVLVLGSMVLIPMAFYAVKFWAGAFGLG